MSKKHFDEYYNQVCQDYSDMIEAIKDLEDECNQGLVSPDRIENMKTVIEPLKTNYMTLSYVKFLLNKPSRNSKQKTYGKQNKKFLESLDKSRSPEEVHNENIDVINKVKEEV